MKKMFGWLALIALPVVLTGCGLKGPLYFPKGENTSQQQQQQETTVKPWKTDTTVPPGTVAP